VGQQESFCGQEVSIDELWRYDGRRAVVTGCASGIGEHVARQLTELGAEVVGLDVKRPALQLREFHEVDLGDAASIDRAAAAIDGPIDALFNIAGVSSGIKDPLRVVTINFLGTRHFIQAMVPKMPPGSAIANVSSLAASAFRENAVDTIGLLDTASMADGIEWCRRNPGPVAEGGGYRLSKEALILYGMANVSALGVKRIRINCTGPGVTDTPILDQLRSAYGQEFLDSFQTPLGRVAGPDEQASVLVFLNSDAARYISGQVIWVDGGSVAERVFGDVTDERKAKHGQPE
jgi:NAD(P)-dependent dehydrogenase (short-subunit alcohol dehydrogenase family)